MGTSLIAWITVLVVVLSPICIYIVIVALSTLTWLQRQILYLHKAPIALGTRLDIPESLGFLKNQTVPFTISVPEDGTRLYAWLIAPLRVFADNEKEFLNDDGPIRHDVEASAAFRLLQADPESRLIIYFHGNSATLGQPRRTDEYRVLASGAPSKIFILTFDYRGFGRSTGSPTETGIVHDAVAVVNWALHVAGIPPSRILLFSQSLGTAVATAAAEHFITAEPKIEFAGLTLCAAFTDAANVFLDFSILGRVPLMGLVKLLPPLANLYRRSYEDKWKTLDRLVTIAGKSERLRLTLVHAQGDVVIPWSHSDSLFYASAAAASGREMTRVEIDEKKGKYDLGQGGYLCRWTVGDKVIKQRILKYGGHDTMMKWEPIALLVLRSFELA